MPFVMQNAKKVVGLPPLNWAYTLSCGQQSNQIDVGLVSHARPLFHRGITSKTYALHHKMPRHLTNPKTGYNTFVENDIE